MKKIQSITVIPVIPNGDIDFPAIGKVCYNKEKRKNKMRKITVKAEVVITMDVDEGELDTGEVINELEWEISDTTGQATVQDWEVRDFEVEDSR